MFFAGSYIYKKIKEKKKEKEFNQDLDDFQKQELKNTVTGYIVEKYQLKPHPEGGYYGETYRSTLSSSSSLSISSHPSSPTPSNNISMTNQQHYPIEETNTIYYLLSQESNHCCFHKNQSIETWHYYDGNTSMVIYEVTTQSKIKVHRLGRNIEEGEHFTITVEKDSWVAAELCNHGDEEKKYFALVGRTSTPASIDYQHTDHPISHLASYEEMIHIFPQNVDLIKRLTTKKRLSVQ